MFLCSTGVLLQCSAVQGSAAQGSAAQGRAGQDNRHMENRDITGAHQNLPCIIMLRRTWKSRSTLCMTGSLRMPSISDLQEGDISAIINSYNVCVNDFISGRQEYKEGTKMSLTLDLRIGHGSLLPLLNLLLAGIATREPEMIPLPQCLNKY